MRRRIHVCETHTNVVPLLVEGIRAGLKEQGDRHRLHDDEEEDTCHLRSRGVATAYRKRRTYHMKRRMHAF